MSITSLPVLIAFERMGLVSVYLREDVKEVTLLMVRESPEPAEDKSPDLIRVSDLGEWVYCNLAWKLRTQGASPAIESKPKIEEGRRWHAEHCKTAAYSVAARRVRNWCFAIALGIAMLTIVLWRAGP